MRYLFVGAEREGERERERERERQRDREREQQKKKDGKRKANREGELTHRTIRYAPAPPSTCSRIPSAVMPVVLQKPLAKCRKGGTKPCTDKPVQSQINQKRTNRKYKPSQETKPKQKRTACLGSRKAWSLLFGPEPSRDRLRRKAQIFQHFQALNLSQTWTREPMQRLSNSTHVPCRARQIQFPSLQKM